MYLPGDFFIRFFGLNEKHRLGDYLFLTGWIVIYLFIAFLSLQFLNKSKR